MQRQVFIHSKIIDNLADPEVNPEDGDGDLDSHFLDQKGESALADAVDTIFDDDPDPVF